VGAGVFSLLVNFRVLTLVPRVPGDTPYSPAKATDILKPTSPAHAGRGLLPP
jgi:hypothetical protein